ncbi:MAG TPA: SDR family oxidoreductase [Bryobacteraceae bacterium]|nr:SDR family oxidoreductase [Bryobacteraceae bacterium]
MNGLQIFSLQGKTALVAGASRGIGLAIAQLMARSGARTILAARSLDHLKSHAGELVQEGHKAEAAALDITSPESIEQLCAAHPEIDILVNVSGTNIRRRFEKYTPEEYDKIMTTNLHGFMRLTQRVGGRMVERGKGGTIVSIGSLMSVAGLPYITVYAMTKSALAGLTRSLASEWGQHNIQVNCIAPGFIITTLNQDMWQPEVMRNWLKGVQANPRTGTPEDIAPLAVFLSGPGSDYITGQVIAADGGYTTTAVWPFAPPE